MTLRVGVPVNARRDPEGIGARKWQLSMMLAGLPLGIADPRERFQAVSRELRSLKEADQAGGGSTSSGSWAGFPAPVQASLSKHVASPNVLTNLICTNVRRRPGVRPSLPGPPVAAHYPWVLATWRMGRRRRQ